MQPIGGHTNTGDSLESSKEDLVETWIISTKTFWANTRVSELCRHEPALALQVIRDILRRDSSDKVVENLAAGPLEDLLVYHGPDVIDEIEALATSDPEFRGLLGGVWRNKIREGVWERVQAWWSLTGSV
jgi:hypothetical protein